MPAPVKKSRQCSLDQLPAFGDSPKMINLFECHRAYGYWPCYNDETGKAELTVSINFALLACILILNVEGSIHQDPVLILFTLSPKRKKRCLLFDMKLNI